MTNFTILILKLLIKSGLLVIQGVDSMPNILCVCHFLAHNLRYIIILLLVKLFVVTLVVIEYALCDVIVRVVMGV